jgi:HEAT repeat protein
MRRRLWLLALLLPVVLAITWFAIPREYLPDFLRRAGMFRGPHDSSSRPTAYWIETLRNSPDLQERRDAAYALAIISNDYGLDREAQEVLPVLLAGMKDRDEWIRRMSMNALGPMGRHAAPAIPALIAEAANRDPETQDVAVMALGQIGPPAKEAVPVLIEVYRQDGDKYSRMFAADALRRIDPQAAAAAGVR